MYKVELNRDGKVSLPLEIGDLLDLHSGESLVLYTSRGGLEKKVEIVKEANRLNVRFVLERVF